MLTEQRKTELINLLQWAASASDDYFLDMEQEEFEEEMDGHEDQEFYMAYVRQRTVGFEEFQREVAVQIAALSSPEELHFMLVNYQSDNGAWTVEQIVGNPACTITTAKMAYWLLEPLYYYDCYGAPSRTSRDDVNIQSARLLTKLEEKAKAGGFPGTLSMGAEEVDVPAPISYEEEPYCNIPEVFR